RKVGSKPVHFEKRLFPPRHALIEGLNIISDLLGSLVGRKVIAFALNHPKGSCKLLYLNRARQGEEYGRYRQKNAPVIQPINSPHRQKVMRLTVQAEFDR